MTRTNRMIGALGALVVAMALTPALGSAAGSRAAPSSQEVAGCQPTASTAVPQPTQALLDAAGLGDLPLAEDAARADLVAGPFSDPTAVTNPLFPIADLDSAILNGHVDGRPFRTETTLLPFTRLIEWTPGQCVRVLVSQYTAFLDGRITETAIDLYAQADDGSVWYLGEDVFDYDPAGRVPTTEGTWHAGTEGPAAMIMPADPQVGDANRPENIPGLVFEEVAVTAVDQTFDGPSGPIAGGIIGTETHEDGTLTEKLFAPGYGEFRSTDGPDVEAIALASPADTLPGGVPRDLAAMAGAADRVFASLIAEPVRWRRAEGATDDLVASWDAFRAGDVPPRLIGPTERALDGLADALARRDRWEAQGASIDAAYATNDLELRYRPVTEVDTARFELWTRRALVDALEGSRGGVRSDQVTLEWIRDRIAHTLDPVTRTRVDTLVGELGAAVVDDELDTAAHVARELLEVVAPLTT